MFFQSKPALELLFALLLDQGNVVGIEVDMGIPKIDSQQVMHVLDQTFDVTPVSMGNPRGYHCE